MYRLSRPLSAASTALVWPPSLPPIASHSPPHPPWAAPSLPLPLTLSQDASRRLGAGGADEIKEHAFFGGVDWASVSTSPDVPFLPRKMLERGLLGPSAAHRHMLYGRQAPGGAAGAGPRVPALALGTVGGGAAKGSDRRSPSSRARSEGGGRFASGRRRRDNVGGGSAGRDPGGRRGGSHHHHHTAQSPGGGGAGSGSGELLSQVSPAPPTLSARTKRKLQDKLLRQQKHEFRTLTEQRKQWISGEQRGGRLSRAGRSRSGSWSSSLDSVPESDHEADGLDEEEGTDRDRDEDRCAHAVPLTTAPIGDVFLTYILLI